MIAGRAAILRNGQEVLLKVEPIDPRDLLRGDYVRLGYEIRNVPVKLVANAPAGEFLTGAGPIFVRLGKDLDGYWRARSASLGEPQGQPPAGEVDIRGMVSGGWTLGPEASFSADYGIDRFYVPEGEGRAIETDMRERPFGILAAVGQRRHRADQGADGRRDEALRGAALLGCRYSGEAAQALGKPAAKSSPGTP